METVTIEVDCTSSNSKTPQLGITVEAPLSQQRALQQRKQQAASKDYSNHGYQNLSTLLDSNNSHQSKHNSNLTSTTHNDHHQKLGNNLNSISNVPSSQRELKPSPLLNGGLDRTVKHGLQITQIQEGSVIDRSGRFRIGDIIIEVNNTSLQLPFVEAQKTLKDFVVNSINHGPLRLKVMRRRASSSSLPSTNGSQTTVVERNGSVSDKSEFSTTRATQPQTNTKIHKLNENLPNNQPNHIKNTSRHLGGPLNTRRIGTKHRVTLAKGKDGFGIKIAERDNMFGLQRPIYITAITTSGAAYRDGRLKEGDMLLEINGIDLSTQTQPEVTRMLKLVRVGEKVEFVISRQENLAYDDYNNGVTVSYEQKNDCDNDTSLINLDDDPDSQATTNNQFEKKVDSILDVPTIDGPGTYVYDIPLNDTKSAGLGLYLKYPNLNGKDLGIWIEKVITGGAAWKDGRLQPNDQILSINGIDLVGLSNAQASETLTAAVCRGIGPQATSNTIRLNIRRRDPLVVAKILHGTNNRIVMDNNLSSSSNSQSYSGLSPQTQASNSMKLSTSFSNSDKTNDNSSATSQITDFTTVQTVENDFRDHGLTVEPVATQPKSLHSEINNVNSEATPSVQSWDDESIDNMTGEERFQRDGFGRQSISEKRHAQLLANTDTFRKNQRLREEREKQRELEGQGIIDLLERQQITDAMQRTQTQTYMQHQPHLDYVLPDRATDTVRSLRGRKINESFRRAVDRSYENNSSSSQMESQSSYHIKEVNSTASTVNEERQLLANPKKSSLISRFLKFGSIKRIRKKHVDKDARINNDNGVAESRSRDIPNGTIVAPDLPTPEQVRQATVVVQPQITVAPQQPAVVQPSHVPHQMSYVQNPPFGYNYGYYPVYSYESGSYRGQNYVAAPAPAPAPAPVPVHLPVPPRYDPHGFYNNGYQYPTGYYRASVYNVVPQAYTVGQPGNTMNPVNYRNCR